MSNFHLSCSAPQKTPDQNKFSPKLTSSQFQDTSYTQKIYPNSYYPSETHHIYHSPLKPLSYPINSTPIRYISPQKFKDSEYFYQKGETENCFNFKTENEKLRIFLKEKQEELYSYMAKCSHLEKHIKDPTILIKYEENELKLQGVIRENMRLHEELAHKHKEIDSWKNSFTRIEASMNDKIIEFETVNNELRSEIEGWKQKYAELEKKLVFKEEMFTKYLNESKNEREENIKQAKHEKQGNEINNSKFISNPNFLNEAQCNELIEKMNILIGENEKLNFHLEQKLEEVEKMKNLLDQQNFELDQWKMKFKQLSYSYDDLQKKDYDDENKISKLTFELENINNLLRTKLNLIEEWKNKHLKLSQLSYKIKEFKEKIYFLTDDNVKLNSISKHKSSEIEKLKEINHNLEIQFSQEKNSFDDLKIKQIKMQNSEENIIIKNQKIELEKQLSLFKIDIEGLNSQIRVLHSENSKMEFFKQENLKLTKNLEEITQESTNLRNHYLENNKLSQKNTELNGIIVVFFAEVETLRNRLSEKEEELINLKNKLYVK